MKYPNIVFALVVASGLSLPVHAEVVAPESKTSQVIQLAVTLPIGARKAFELFTTEPGLTAWFAPIAKVDPVAGGSFEIFFDPSDLAHNNCSGCKINALVPDKLLVFDWKGPKQFEHLMDNADPKPQVVVAFIPCDNNDTCTEVQLVHSGFHSSWRSTESWQGPYDWFVPVWGEAFAKLKESATTGKRWFE